MIKIGYALSSEEHSPSDLIRFSTLAEDAGFSFALVSDHYHPWISEQGESPFVWNLIGALSQSTKHMQIGIGVNCPILRYHPAIIAQAAATSQVMLEGRFILGLGTGENLNEHIIGQGWPPIKIRQEMLIEAIEVIKLLLQGGYQSYYGNYFNVDTARIYTMPKVTIPIIISAYGTSSAQIAGIYGDGFISTAPNKELIQVFEESAGITKPKFGQVHICFDKDMKKAKDIVKKVWPNSAMPKPLNTELRLPRDFERTAELVQIDEATKDIPVGPDLDKILTSIDQYKKAGFDHVYLHQIGPNQEEFINFAKNKILPNFKTESKNQTKTKLAALHNSQRTHNWV